jgi:hypothetical protein
MSIDNKFILSVKSQGSMEYILIISAIAIVIVVAIAFVLLTGGKATSSGSYKGEILNATMVYSPAGDNIGPGNLSNSAYPTNEYMLLATNYPLSNIPKNTTVIGHTSNGYPIYSNFVFANFSSAFIDGYNGWEVPYNQGNITEVYDQNGEYVYAINFTDYTQYGYIIVPLSYITISINGKNTTLIANPKPLKVNFIKTNSAYVSLLPTGNIGKLQTANATFIITGLPTNSVVALSYYNISKSSQVTDNIVINSTSVAKIVNASQAGEFSSVPESISYNGISYYISSSNTYYIINNNVFYAYYTSGSIVNYPYYTLSTTPIEYTLNKPLVNGAEVTFTLPNSTYYYPENPFSNLEVSVSNTIANGGTQINAFVANYTTTSITLNLGNIPSGNIQTVYLNFLPAGQIGSDLWFSPEYSSSNPGVITTPPPTGTTGIFSSYNDNGGEGYQPTASAPDSFSYVNLADATQSTSYIVGINENLCTVNSLGFDINNAPAPNTGNDQAPYNGTYDIGSGCKIFIGAPFGNFGPPIYTSISGVEYYVGPIIFNYTLSGNTINLNTEIGGTYYSYPYSGYLIPQGTPIYLDDFYGDITPGFYQLIYYYAISPNNVFNYTTTGMTIV